MWLFGLALGVANACAQGDSAHHVDRVDVAASIDARHHGDAGGERADATGLAFCEKSPIGALPLKVVGGSYVALGLAVPLSGTLPVVALREPASGRRAGDSPHLRGGPPLRTALQRLAL